MTHQQVTPEVAGNADSVACRSELRDPWTVTLSFVENPAPFRGACQFFRQCWDQAVYFEGELPCPYVVFTSSSSTNPDSFGLEEEDSHKEGGVLMAGVLSQQRLPACLELPLTAPIRLANLGLVSEAHPCELHLVRLRGLFSINNEMEGSESDSDGEDGGGVKSKENTSHAPPTRRTSFSLTRETKVGAGVTKIRVAQCPDLESIGEHFTIQTFGPEAMARLQEVVLEDLPNLRSIGGSFLMSCNCLERVRLSRLPQLTTIGECFLGNCLGLQQVVVEGAPMLTSFGWYYCLWQCQRVTGILRVEGMPNLASLGRQAFKNCCRLEKIVIANLPQLSEIGDESFSDCWDLRELHLVTLPRLQGIGKEVLKSSMSELEKVVMEGLPELTEIGEKFLDNCVNLSKIRIASLPKLQKTGSRFLAGAKKLIQVEIEDLPELTQLGWHTLNGCDVLDTFHLRDLPKLQRIPPGFLANSKKLREVSFELLPEVVSCCHRCLWHCPSLTQVTFMDLPKLEGLDSPKELFSGCSSLKRIQVLATATTSPPPSVGGAPTVPIIGKQAWDRIQKWQELHAGKGATVRIEAATPPPSVGAQGWPTMKCINM